MWSTRLCNTHLIGMPWDFVEVPVDDVAGRPGERGCPVAEELCYDGERRGRGCSGVRQPLDGCAVCGLRASADGVGHVHHLVAILEGLDACKRQADFGVEPADDQSLLPGGLHGSAEGRVLEGVHRGPIDRLDAVKLGEDRWKSGAIEAVLDTDRRKHYRHAERLGGLRQKPDMQLD
jgi:hypothetical protein